MCASGLRCLVTLVPTLAAQFVQSQQPLVVGSPSAVTVCPAPALAVQGVWSQSFVPSCCSCLLGSLEVSSATFWHLGLLSHPILLLFLHWVFSFGIYSGLGLRCCSPGYGSSLFFFCWGGGGGGPLSLVLVVLAWLLQLFCFVQVTWVSWTFCGGLFPLDFQCLLVVWSGLRYHCVSLWMGLWCGHAVLPIPSFDLVFLFHLLGQVVLALVKFFVLSLLSLLFFFCFSFLPFCLDLFGLGVFVPFRRLLFCAFVQTSSSSFLRDVLLPPGSGVLRRSCLFLFFFEVFLSALEISFSSRPFFFFGGEVWLGPSVFGPALGFVDSSFGPEKICSSVFAWAVSCSASFLLCMWFRQNLGVSSLRRSLWWSAGGSDPGTFCWCCGTLSLPCRSLWPFSLWALGRGFLFCLSFRRLWFPFYRFF